MVKQLRCLFPTGHEKGNFFVHLLYRHYVCF